MYWIFFFFFTECTSGVRTRREIKVKLKDKKKWKGYLQMFTNTTNSIADYSLPEINNWVSIVGQCLRILLPMQGHGFDPLVQEDPTCHKATKPMGHSCWAHVPRSWALHQEKPQQQEAHTPQLESGPHPQQLEKALTVMKTQHSHK